MSVRHSIAALAACAALALTGTACSNPSNASPSRAAATAADQRAQHAVDGLQLKKHYSDLIMGTDVKGPTLLVYVDVNNLYSMDEDSESALRSNLLQSWKRIWSAAHPGKHARLRLSFRDYYGNEIISDTARV